MRTFQPDRYKEVSQVILSELGVSDPDWNPRNSDQARISRMTAETVRVRLQALLRTFPPDLVRELVLRSPGWALAITADTLKPKVATMAELLGVSETEALRQVFLRAPLLLSRTPDALRERVEALAEVIGDRALAQTAVLKQSKVLEQSVEAIKHKHSLLKSAAAAYPAWEAELKAASPTKMAVLLHAGLPSVMRLQYLKEKGTFPALMFTLVRYTTARWDLAYPDYAAWYEAQEAAPVPAGSNWTLVAGAAAAKKAAAARPGPVAAPVASAASGKAGAADATPAAVRVASAAAEEATAGGSRSQHPRFQPERYAEVSQVILNELGVSDPDWNPPKEDQTRLSRMTAETVRVRLQALLRAFPPDLVRELVLRSPGWALAITADTVKPKVAIMAEVLGVSELEALQKIFLRAPLLLSRNADALRERVEALGTLLGDRTLGVNAVLKQPQVLGQSFETMQYKYGILTAATAANPAWEVELAAASPTKMAVLLHSGLPALMRLRYLTEKGTFPALMTTIVRYTSAKWDPAYPDYADWLRAQPAMPVVPSASSSKAKWAAVAAAAAAAAAGMVESSGVGHVAAPVVAPVAAAGKVTAGSTAPAVATEVAAAGNRAVDAPEVSDEEEGVVPDEATAAGNAAVDAASVVEEAMELEVADLDEEEEEEEEEEEPDATSAGAGAAEAKSEGVAEVAEPASAPVAAPVAAAVDPAAPPATATRFMATPPRGSKAKAAKKKTVP